MSRIVTMGKFRAFTLVELLVVIAIVAVLAALLFPVFANAKLAGKRTVCLSNQKQIGLAVALYVSDADGAYPRTHTDSNGDGLPGVITWWAVNDYQGALRPYLRQARGGIEADGRVNGRDAVWFDPADPDRAIRFAWGSFMDNGLLTGIQCAESEIAYPSETVFNFVHEKRWHEVNEVPLPDDPGADDPFWSSEYFDMCLDTWSPSEEPSDAYHWKRRRPAPPCRLFPSDRACVDWTEQIDGYSARLGAGNRPRYGRGVPFTYADGHARVAVVESTYRSADDNQWDLR